MKDGEEILRSPRKILKHIEKHFHEISGNTDKDALEFSLLVRQMTENNGSLVKRPNIM